MAFPMFINDVFMNDNEWFAHMFIGIWEYEEETVNWIELAKNGNKWLEFVVMVTYFQVM